MQALSTVPVMFSYWVSMKLQTIFLVGKLIDDSHLTLPQLPSFSPIEISGVPQLLTLQCALLDLSS